MKKDTISKQITTKIIRQLLKDILKIEANEVAPLDIEFNPNYTIEISKDYLCLCLRDV